MVKAEYAGCGKSYACKSMEQLGCNVLFVCPTNKLVQNNKDNGTTLNKFFSIGMTEETKMKKFDDSGYDVIVFDEIYFANVQILARIKNYVSNNPNKIILATGDTCQLETIDPISDQKDYDKYFNHCINTIFPNEINLLENKRLKTKEDKDTLKQLKSDIFNKSIPIKNTIKKYFKLVNSISTEYNIAYKNDTCSSVSKTVRISQNRKDDFDIGETLVCRKYLKTDKQTFNVNYEYNIVKVSDNSLTIKDCSINESYTVPTKTIEDNFIHGYCRTCHSYQGSSIDDKLTIFDWDFYFVDRKWIYTAITRATNLNNVYFYNGKIEEFNKQKLECYLNKKVLGYITQDKESKRIVNKDNYITKKWLMNCFGGSCCSCGCDFQFTIGPNGVSSNLSAQRIDNTLGHEINNIIPYCVSCNCNQSNK